MTFLKTDSPLCKWPIVTVVNAVSKECLWVLRLCHNYIVLMLKRYEELESVGLPGYDPSENACSDTFRP